ASSTPRPSRAASPCSPTSPSGAPNAHRPAPAFRSSRGALPGRASGRAPRKQRPIGDGGRQPRQASFAGRPAAALAGSAGDGRAGRNLPVGGRDQAMDDVGVDRAEPPVHDPAGNGPVPGG